jgi:hypothetical protein
MTRLIIIVDSERPDAYLNSVVHNLRSRATSEVSFIHVHGFPGDTGSRDPSDLAARVLGSVLRRLEALALRAEYVDDRGALTALDRQNGSISSEAVKRFYSSANIRSVKFSSEEIHYRDLRTFLRTVRRKGRDYVVDITGGRKRFIGDFVALGLVDDLGGVRTFDVLVPIDFARPWRFLLHELETRPTPAFEYVDLLETRIILDCARAVVVRAPRFGLAWAFAVTLAALGVGINWWSGLDSNVAKWVNVLAQFATFAALAFIFFPPRSP